MALRTRIEPIDRSIALALRQGESPEDLAKALAGYARQALADAQEQNRQAIGAVPPHETFVDGRRAAPLESVRPNGVIVFEFELMADMFGYIDLLLIKHSPVRSGRFRRSHILLADGIEVDPSAAILPEAQEFVYLNAQPYARKIERGLSRQAPDGVYESVAALASRRFGNMASIRFGYRSMVSPYIRGGRNRAERHALKSQPERLAAMRKERATRQPAIIITR